MKYFALLGDLISHSLSPKIHTHFGQRLGIALSYIPIQVKKSEFPHALKDLQRKNYTGVNITSPLKELAYTLMDECSPEANQAKSINTILFKPNNHLYGDNTDGIGLLHDLKINHKIPINNKKILILGAGGATRGILSPLLKEKPSTLYIANRTQEKAAILTQEFGSETHTLINYLSLNQLSVIAHDLDLILNTIPSNIEWQFPKCEINPNTLCYDLCYNSNITPFLEWSHRSGSKHSLNGLGMLFEQARYAFKLWTGKMPEADSFDQ